MLRYVAQRLVFLVLILFVVSAASFYLIHLLPGNPAAVILGVADTPSNQAALYRTMGLNKPIYEQYFIWISHILDGNFGHSFVSGASVRTTISGALPIEAELTLLSQVMALGLAVPMAFRAARKPNGWFDRVVTSTSFVLLSIPTFVVIIILGNLLAVTWSVPFTAPSLYTPGGDWVTNFYILLLPAFAIAIGTFTVYYRVLRSDLISTYQEEFITLARSKGLSRRRIVLRHAFRPSSIALLGTAGLVISGQVAGNFIVEYLLGIPGMGFQLISAIGASDYITIQGIVLLLSTFAVVLAIIADLLFGFVDPRISRE